MTKPAGIAGKALTAQSLAVSVQSIPHSHHTLFSSATRRPVGCCLPRIHRWRSRPWILHLNQDVICDGGDGDWPRVRPPFWKDRQETSPLTDSLTTLGQREIGGRSDSGGLKIIIAG